MAIIKHKEQTVAIFIDVQNLYYSARHLYSKKVNFAEIVRIALANRKLIRAIAYVVSTKTGEEKPFFEALGKIGIETKEKELQEFFGGAKKADWDVGIAIDMVRICPIVSTVILVSGDGDFTPVVEYMKSQGKQVELVAFGRTTSAKLKEATDDFTDLDKNVKKFLLR
ncbi:MAG: hypothetical protein US71_C0021G0007 [Parcubacteria group bacterium GW2011_GWD2_38_12]|uniref:NYN domain-containing protein n=1 Tax=Candidatus Azambacteria bacterium RIFCSPLOWO2_01_FULL_37_9 TaxID=1797297 RepID=A0A1F5C810_9BACT|nr:MAG: hypothetical protein US06_C0020G0002 [Parcubacteria group bacterium GW2011_GWC2_36_17]KKQ40541.1 MAG: hypothetical protein US56_C0002G0003 [Candidatus Moranbacteria bacterium GW2011_GWF2_37_7]KKQ43340.1 MAG: hypothetical protein US61_C0012G0014 [Parcubacteria group bacterium GW2011_GWE2_37_8]KKQ50955.1 MAG: hypothetical protein US71_C0021G0007 [Parcubacteria group bacterium GW2011_GWD2_38_12]KKQ58036.1 MAG: hypothetical protein US79_C0016G0002 [Parcubacteria group bacterium GW2011_GWC1_